MVTLSLSHRLRHTSFSDGVKAAGVKAYTVYSYMSLPTVFRSPIEECRHPKSAVQVWDVSCERRLAALGAMLCCAWPRKARYKILGVAPTKMMRAGAEFSRSPGY